MVREQKTSHASGCNGNVVDRKTDDTNYSGISLDSD